MTARKSLKWKAAAIRELTRLAFLFAAALVWVEFSSRTSIPLRILWSCAGALVAFGVMWSLRAWLKCPQCRANLWKIESDIAHGGDVSCPHCGASFDGPRTP